MVAFRHVVLYFQFSIKRYNTQQYMFKTNLQKHTFKQVFEILQHTRLLSVFSPVFAFFSLLNKDRPGIEISYCFEK